MRDPHGLSRTRVERRGAEAVPDITRTRSRRVSVRVVPARAGVNGVPLGRGESII